MEAIDLKMNQLDLAARAFAGQKAREVCGEVVDLILNRTCARVENLDYIRNAEELIERRLTALLKNCMVEFFRDYGRDMEERMLHMEKLVENKVMMQATAPLILPALNSRDTETGGE